MSHSFILCSVCETGEAMIRALLTLFILWIVSTLVVIGSIEIERHARLDKRITAVQASLDEVKQKTEATMLYIGEMEAREWRKEQKRKQGK